MTTTVAVPPPNVDGLPAPAEFATAVLRLPLIQTEQGAEGAAFLLTMALDLQNAVHAHYDPVVKRAHEAHTAALAARAQFLEPITQAEKHLRALLSTWAARVLPPPKEGAPATAVLPAGLQATKGKGMVVFDDVNAIPREFLAPDEKKILAALKAGLTVPGCHLEQGTQVKRTRKAGPPAGPESPEKGARLHAVEVGAVHAPSAPHTRVHTAPTGVLFQAEVDGGPPLTDDDVQF